jgi:uncharacterized membrane protein YebE (DUF533 family)
MLQSLEAAERLRLLAFVTSAAWADFRVSAPERAYILDLIARLGLEEEEAELVRAWMMSPPPAELVDPMEVPPEHRQIFLDAVLGVSAVDGVLTEGETETFNLLSQLLG